MGEEEDYSNGAMEATPTTSNKRRKISPPADTDRDTDSKFALFDKLPDDLVAIIISKLGATASCPADYFNLRFTCKRLNKLGLDPSILSKISPNVFPRAKNWKRDANIFMRKLVVAGNLEAIYTLGMILFYIHKDIKFGKGLIGDAANKHHLSAMHAMAVIHLNGSGGTENDKNVRYAIKNLATAALLGHVEAIREIGYRIRDGYIIEKNVEEGRRLILQATAREIVSRLIYDDVNGGWDRISVPVPIHPWTARGRWVTSVPCGPNSSGPVPEFDLTIMSDFGWGALDPVPHPANCFLVEWFALRGGDPGNGLRLCSRVMCGRPETRKDEFFRCPLCGGPCYCSRGCQSMDWNNRHHVECVGNEANFSDRDDDDDDDNDDEENDEDVAVDEI